MKMIVRLASLTALAVVTSGQSFASDVDDLNSMLENFLAKSYTEVAHDAFWADDLVYTSSAGLRFGKADIMASFADAPATDAAPDTEYSATETDIRIYGDTAIVAFKLVGTPAKGTHGGKIEYYFNTGTFLRRDSEWQVVAWQATRIPATE